MTDFDLKNQYKKARIGILKTNHGEVGTPNMAFVATHGKIKLLNKTDQKERAKPDLIIANTFHLWVNDQVEKIKKAGGIHKWSGWKKPIITDSGGFQVFSLGWGKAHRVGKFQNPKSKFQINSKSQIPKNQTKILNDGVVFEYNGKKYKLTPEESIKLQHDIGADIIFAFDECTSPYHGHAYNLKALKRTHDWAIRSLEEHKRIKKTPGVRCQIFGIVQGGVYEDLRIRSSKFIGSLDFDGFGIGGSFGEKQMAKVIQCALSGLPEEKPRHLLGIGKLKDILIAVEKGIDLFDCVIPTREARHGVLFTKNGKIYINKGIFSDDKKLIEKNCGCFVCQHKIYRKAMHYLFKKDKLKAQRMATIHNIYFYKVFFRKIRELIYNKKGLNILKKEYNLQ